MPEPPIIDLRFPIRGRSVPFDHGYALYAALCRQAPEAHGAPWLGIHPIRGRKLVSGTVGILPASVVGLRLPLSHLVRVLPLAGAHLDIGGAAIVLGTPTVEQLGPARSLDARIVAIKLTGMPKTEHARIDKEEMRARFSAEIGRQIERLDVHARVAILGRQQVTVGRKRVLGFSVRLDELTDEDSLKLQSRGLGGKRRMGCGLFTPTRGGR